MSSETRGLLLFVAGGLLAITYALKPDWWSFTNFLAAASAVGTIAAAWAALWLAGQADRKQEAHTKQLASLAAASIIAQLEGAMAYLQAATTALKLMDAKLNLDDPNHRETAYSNSKAAIVECLIREDWTLDPQLVRALLPLPDRAAHRIEYACRCLVALRRDAMPVHERWLDFTPHERGRYIRRWTGALSLAHEYLTAALQTCEEVAGIESLHPTPEELYGSGHI